MGREPIVIIGSGAAGLGAAYGLTDTDHRVVVLEAVARVGGRLVTRVLEDTLVDTAANYITPADGDFDSLLRSLGTTGLIDIPEPVYTHTADGMIAPGDPDRQNAHKWTYTTGIHTFANRVLGTINQSVRLRETVGSIHETHTGWDINRPTGSTILTAATVICTPPAPHTASILEDSTSTSIALDPIASAIRSVSYRSIVTCILGYEHELDRPFYASVNTDGEHPIGWVSREECKPNHVPEGQSVLVVQMAPWWSADNIDAPKKQIIDTATTTVSELLDTEWVHSPSWTVCDRFPTAFPNSTPPTASLEPAESAGLYFAGDWLVGRGRVSNAFLTGIDATDPLTESTIE